MDGLNTTAFAPLMDNALAHNAKQNIKNATGNLTGNKAGIDIKKVEQAAEEFEAVFIGEMLKPMFEGIETKEPFGGGKGEEVFRGMMITEYGKMISQNGGIGLADHIKETMIQLQEEANGLSAEPNYAPHTQLKKGVNG